MKKLLMWLGAIFALILVLVVLLVVKGSVADRESKRYADASIIAIVSNWNEQALLGRASPEFMQHTSKAQIDALFARLRPLGHLTRYAGSTGTSFFNYNAGSGSTTTAVYLANAYFERGTAQIKLSLIKRNGAWKVAGFFVDGNGSSNFQTSFVPERLRPAEWAVRA